jgi:phospho-N-acetylmuramoyl-pentapeptide-transferase
MISGLGLLPSVTLAAAQVMPADENENMAVSLALASLAFGVTIIIGRPMITFLRERKFGKKVRDELTIHVGKTGTPTMGGLMITSSAVVVTLVFNTVGRLSMLLPIGVLIAAGVLGAVDDRMNLVGGRKTGMTARFKFVWLTVVGMVGGFILHLPDPWGLGLHDAYVPFFGQFDIGWIYVPIAAVAIVGMSNAVNLTDGLDTLAAITAAIAFCAYGIIAYRQGQLGVVTFCFTKVAQVIMGDTGALAIGAALATAAFMTGQWLLLPVVGAVFIAEMLSVMLQVGYYKLSGGKRIFKMSPLHHHFEILGWSETQVTMRFAIAGMMAGLLGVALALL